MMTILICIALICILIGFVSGRIGRPVELPSLDHLAALSDGAIARMAHEAYRAYANSIGSLSVKGWAGLTQAERDEATKLVGYFRDEEKAVLSAVAPLKVRLAHLLANLAR